MEDPVLGRVVVILKGGGGRGRHGSKEAREDARELECNQGEVNGQSTGHAGLGYKTEKRRG